MTRQELFGTWASTALCATTVAVAVFYNSVGGTGIWTNVIIWLPMCFFFVSIALYRQQKAIGELKQEIARLQKSDATNENSGGPYQGSIQVTLMHPLN
jgi:hypothetical protein